MQAPPAPAEGSQALQERQESATVLSHILKNCRQGNSIERVECVPFRASLCGVKHHLSPCSWFGVTASLLMWVQIFQPSVKGQGFKIFIGFNLLIFTCV